jgi:hypothetical protein
MSHGRWHSRRAKCYGEAMTPFYRAARRRVDAQNEPMPINWRRGLFRVWILFSVAWIMGWTIYLIMSAIQDGFRSTGDIVVIPILLFGPPVALLLFGKAAGWAFRGFQMDEIEKLR